MQRPSPRPAEIAAPIAAAADNSTGYYVGLAVTRDGRRAYASDGQGSGVHTFTIAGRSEPS